MERRNVRYVAEAEKCREETKNGDNKITLKSSIGGKADEKAWKKAVSVLLILVLLFGVLPAMNVSAEGEGGQGSRSIELNFAGTVNGSIVTYGVEGTDVALTVEGAELNDSKVSISEGNLGSVKFKLENFDPDKMQIVCIQTMDFKHILR